MLVFLKEKRLLCSSKMPREGMTSPIRLCCLAKSKSIDDGGGSSRTQNPQCTSRLHIMKSTRFKVPFLFSVGSGKEQQHTTLGRLSNTSQMYHSQSCWKKSIALTPLRAGPVIRQYAVAATGRRVEMSSKVEKTVCFVITIFFFTVPGG